MFHTPAHKQGTYSNANRKPVAPDWKLETVIEAARRIEALKQKAAA